MRTDELARARPQPGGAAVEQPHAHEAVEEERSLEGRDFRREALAQRSFLARLAVRAFERLQQLAELAQHARQLRAEVAHVFALELHHAHRAPRAPATLERVDHADRNAST